MAPGIDLFHTLELQHASFLTGAPPVPFAIRCVAETFDDQTFTLEPSAVIDPSAAVVFTALPFWSRLQAIEEGKPPTCEITIDNIAREILPYLMNASKYRADLITIYRQYRSDDTSGPCYGPTQFVIKQVAISPPRIKGLAQINNLANMKFPRTFFTLQENPGLQP
jgi:hypothetical protein